MSGLKQSGDVSLKLTAVCDGLPSFAPFSQLAGVLPLDLGSVLHTRYDVLTSLIRL